MASKTPIKLASVAAAVAVAACTYSLAGASEVDGGLVLLPLTPAGEFLPSDGRTLDSPPWNICAASAQAVIHRFRARNQPPVIDYEHQTLNKEKNGQPAPAAGWMRDLRWIDGKGLYAVTELTARAKGFIESKEYLYISPVFEYSKETGTVLAIHMAALTNTPALHGMDPLTLRAAATAAFLIPPTQQEPTLNPLLKAVLAALGLPETTTEAAAIAGLEALGPISALKDKADAACTGLGLQTDASAASVIAACTSLRTASVDPAKYVPVAVVDELRTNISALTARQAQIDIDAAIAPALADGRLLPGAQETWARDLGKTNLAALTAYLATAQPIAALTSTQTHGKPPAAAANGAAQLSPEQLAVCSAMGLTPETFKAGAAA